MLLVYATLPVPSNDCVESVVTSPLTVKFLEVASAVASALPVVLPEEPDNSTSHICN